MFMVIFIGLFAVFAGIGFFYAGVQEQKMSGLMAETPTTLSNMISSFGLHGIKGTIECEDTHETPVTGEPCAWYRILHETRKGKYWVVDSDEQSGGTFMVRDGAGTFPVNPYGAEVDVPSIETPTASNALGSLGIGNLGVTQQMTIWALYPGDEVYVLGDVQPGPGGKNCIGSGDGSSPFIISTKNEEELVSSGGTNAIVYLVFGAVLIIVGIGMIVAFLSLG